MSFSGLFRVGFAPFPASLALRGEDVKREAMKHEQGAEGAVVVERGKEVKALMAIPPCFGGGPPVRTARVDYRGAGGRSQY